MDFFAHQDRARRRTGWLVVGVVIAVVLLVVSVDAAALGILKLVEGGRDQPLGESTGVLAGVTLGVLALVGLGTSWKTSSLARGGGAAVASSLGGRRVTPEGESQADRRLMNVVEEMAIASGVPMPQVYVLEGEPRINAFAAGMKPGDAVVAVTRGTLDNLDRDELQGVVAHEFSHILNGDMRINMRMIGLVHGILMLALTGRIILTSLRHVRVRSSNGKGGGAVAIIVLVGAALFVLGSVGWIASRILKAALSRQREFLADAAAVQFTRNPVGLSGALQKLMGRGTKLQNGRAAEVSHLCFGNALSGGLFGLLSTHPPLEKRLDAIDPGWRDRPPERAPKRPRPERKARTGRPPSRPPLVPLPAAEVPALIGSLAATSPEVGAQALDAMPGTIRDASSSTFSARALALAAIADRTPELGRAALAALGSADPNLAAEAVRLHPVVGELDADESLSVVLTAIPALRTMTGPQRQHFLDLLMALVRSDGVVSLEEHALAELVALHLGARPGPRHRPSHATIHAASADLLAVLARAGSRSEAEGRAAFLLGARESGLAFDMPEAPASPRLAFHQALETCRAALPDDKRTLVSAAAYTVSADGLLSPTEGALLQLVVDALECPMPRLAILQPSSPEG